VNTPEGNAWRILAGIKGVGPKALWLIFDRLAALGKTASWLIENPGKIKDILPAIQADSFEPGFSDRKDKAGVRPANSRVTVLHPLHPYFPRQIRNLKNTLSLPALLYADGNVAILNRPAVAIIGKRNASAQAKTMTASLASELAGLGVNVISGYAAGIDSAAHLAALRAGGTTSIILAEGIEHFQVKAEMNQILTRENTLVISQFEPGAKWAAYMAMTRNKLVAALSKAVVVIVSGPERDAGGKNSGTFAAARGAMKMGIPVFVTAPGSFAEPQPGNLELIKKGCLEWDAAAGAAPILAALLTRANPTSPPGQLSLFEIK